MVPRVRAAQHGAEEDPMFTVTASIDIDRSAEAVFAFLVDPQNWPRWVDDVRRVEARAPLQKGDRFEEVVVFRGDEKRSRGQVVDLERDRLLVLRVDEVVSGPKLLPTRRFELAANGASTRLTWTSEVRTRGLMRLFQPLLPKLFRKKKAGFLDALKRALEGGSRAVSDR